jgi:hypothetical protein
LSKCNVAMLKGRYQGDGTKQRKIMTSQGMLENPLVRGHKTKALNYDILKPHP